MSVNSWVDIFNFLVWIFAIICGTYLGNRFLNLKKLNLKSQFLKILVDNAVNSYEKTDLSNEGKKHAAVREVAASLSSKGFKVSEQTLLDIEQSVETAIKEIKKGSEKNG